MCDSIFKLVDFYATFPLNLTKYPFWCCCKLGIVEFTCYVLSIWVHMYVLQFSNVWEMYKIILRIQWKNLMLAKECIQIFKMELFNCSSCDISRGHDLIMSQKTRAFFCHCGCHAGIRLANTVISQNLTPFCKSHIFCQIFEILIFLMRVFWFYYAMWRLSLLRDNFWSSHYV